MSLKWRNQIKKHISNQRKIMSWLQVWNIVVKILICKLRKEVKTINDFLIKLFVDTRDHTSV